MNKVPTKTYNQHPVVTQGKNVKTQDIPLLVSTSDQINNDKNNQKKTNSKNLSENTKIKVKRQLLKLDDKILLDSENGIKRLYTNVMKTDFKSSNNIKNLNKLMNLYKNWHFELFPKYEFELFLSKVNDIGLKGSGKVKSIK